MLPGMGNAGSVETFFIAASTDLERAEIMMKRIREQLQSGAGFGGAGLLQVSATAVPLPSPADGKSLEAQVQAVADRITEMAMPSIATKSSSDLT